MVLVDYLVQSRTGVITQVNLDVMIHDLKKKVFLSFVLETRHPRWISTHEIS